MGDIQKLTDEILMDAKQKAGEILAEATAHAEYKHALAEREAVAHKNRILHRAEIDAKLITERIVSAANLQLRDDKLSAKGKIIDQVMDRVKEKIKGIPAAEEFNYIVNKLKTRSLKTDEKLIVRPGMAAKLKQALPTVAISEQEGVYGFIIDREGVIENHSFDTQLDFLKDDLEAQASQILFPN